MQSYLSRSWPTLGQHGDRCRHRRDQLHRALHRGAAGRRGPIGAGLTRRDLDAMPRAGRRPRGGGHPLQHLLDPIRARTDHLRLGDRAQPDPVRGSSQRRRAAGRAYQRHQRLARRPDRLFPRQGNGRGSPRRDGSPVRDRAADGHLRSRRHPAQQPGLDAAAAAGLRHPRRRALPDPAGARRRHRGPRRARREHRANRSSSTRRGPTPSPSASSWHSCARRSAAGPWSSRCRSARPAGRAADRPDRQGRGAATRRGDRAGGSPDVLGRPANRNDASRRLARRQRGQPWAPLVLRAGSALQATQVRPKRRTASATTAGGERDEGHDQPPASSGDARNASASGGTNGIATWIAAATRQAIARKPLVRRRKTDSDRLRFA